MGQTVKNLKHENPIVLITGGSGFLGKNLVKELLDPNGPLVADQIRVFDIKSYEGEHKNEINFFQGDIQDYEKLARACEGVDLIIHAAAVIDWGTKDPSEVLSVNVGGTKNVIRACREQGVQNLIYTSSLDAVYTGKPLVDINEDQDYPKKPHNAYCQSKLESEQLVLKADGPKLRTSVLRPSDIYGEEDPYHIDPLIKMAQSGFYTRLGNGKSKCQHVYVGNMAMAHVQLAKAMLQQNSKVFGKVYFITDGPGYNFFSFFDRIVIGAGYTLWPKNFWLPKELALPLAGLTEFAAFLIRPFKRLNVKFSRFAVAYTCTDFTFSSKRAQQDFNFSPKYSVEEGLERTSAYYRGLNKSLK